MKSSIVLQIFRHKDRKNVQYLKIMTGNYK